MITSFDTFLGVSFKEFIIKTNNYCNLHCYQCTNLCDISIKSTNDNIFRRKKWEISTDDLVLFCERFKGIGEDNVHILTGAETTMMPVLKVREIIDVLEAYGRKMKLRTTGWNLVGIGEKHISKITQGIFLADHGHNKECVDECLVWLKTFYKYRVKAERYYTHLNLREIAGHPANKGKRCLWMETTFLLEDIIYPCHNMPWLMALENTTKVKDELREAGWSIYNDKIVEVLKNWRTTMPGYVDQKCLNDCWAPMHNSIGKSVKITKKRIDSLCKRRKN